MEKRAPDDGHDACLSAPTWAPMMLMMLARRRFDMGPDDAHDACPSAPMWAPMMLMMLARRRSDMGPDDAHDACPSAPMWAPMMLMMLARRRSDMGPDDAHDACLSAAMWVPMMLMIACWLGLGLLAGFPCLLHSVLKPFCLRILLLETCMISEDLSLVLQSSRLLAFDSGPRKHCKNDLIAKPWNIAHREPDEAAMVA